MRRLTTLIPTLTAAAALLLLAPAGAHAQNAQCAAWMDPAKPAEQRARALLAAMTIDEKVRLTYGSASPVGFASEVPANDRLCIPAFVQSDGPAGISGGFTGTQAGVTAYPTGMAQAATWDPELNRRLGSSMAQEALGKGANVLLAPAVNINRVPNNGRNFEYFGEDPFLSARMTVAQVRGIQSNPVVATVKHYAVNNQETERSTISAEVDERTQREIYLPAFEAAVREAQVGSAMCAYNRVNGTYACENDTLLNKVLKGDWGFDGWVMSDWFATHTTEKAALAGMDQEQNGFGAQHFGDKLKAAVQSGKVPMARLDDMALRVLRPAFRLGLFDRRPTPQPAAATANVSTPERQKLALDVAQQGSVLLKNDGILPLDRVRPGTRIAVIGKAASATATPAAAGSGSAHVNAVAVDPLSAITQRAAAQGAIVTHVPGDAHADAAIAARAADIAIVFVRDNAGEGNDRPGENFNDGVCTLLFCVPIPTDQDGMVNAVADANPNTVVVMLTGGPIAMPWLGKVKGLLEMWYPGQRYGDAAASLLFGDVNPSGKLPQTFARSAKDLPTRTPEQYPGRNGKALYSEGMQVGYRWFDSQRIEPLFPFGHGLSYTTFRLSGLRVEPGPAGSTSALVTVDVENTGARAGAEVAQVYVGFPPAAGEPPKQLKGFDRAYLAAGERQTVRIPLDRRAFSYWDTKAGDWRVAPGCYTVMAGRSSRAIDEQATIAIGDAACDGAAARLALPSRSTQCFSRRRVTVRLRDPKGRERIRTVTVRIAGKRVSTLRGKRLRSTLRRRGGVRVDLLGRRGRVTVDVRARTTRGRTIRRRTTLRLCVPRTTGRRGGASRR